MKIGILNSHNQDYLHYENACKNLKVDYQVINFIGKDWLSECEKSGCDGFLVRPPCDFPERKAMYDERLIFLAEKMKKPIYPGLGESLFYENKRALVNWLDYYKLPHPKTFVLGSRKEAMDFVEKAKYPFVSKSAIGSSASGVLIVKNKFQAKILVNQFFGWGITGLTRGKTYWHWVKKKWLLPALGSEQKHYMIVQEFCPLLWEHRLIRIGDSYFGYKKVVGKNGFASGSGFAEWGKPPMEVLEKVREWTDMLGIRSMAIDVFETKNGEFLINEMQTVFGNKVTPLLSFDGKAGRFVYRNHQFEFEEGVFTIPLTYELRVLDFIECLKAEGIK